MQTTFTKKLVGFVLSIFSLTIMAQCPSITNLNMTLGANGTASISPVLSGTVSPTQTVYYWQVSPGASLNSNSFQSQGEFQFPANGTYIVCLSINDSLNGCSSNQYCDSINIGNMSSGNCSASFTAYTDSNCVTRFTNTSLGGTLSYGWTINGVYYSSTDPMVNLPNGNHLVLLQTYYAGQLCDSVYQYVNVGCSGTNTVSCHADFTYFTDSTCVTYLSNTSTGNNLTYQWYDITNNTQTLISTVANPSLNLSQGYTVLQLATFSNGTFCDSVTNYVNVNCGNPTGNCQANSQFMIFPDSINPTGGNYFAYNTSYGTGTVSYSWDFGDGTASSQQYPFHQYAVPGQYIICLTVNGTYTNALGTATCTNSYCDSSSVQRMASGFLMSQMNVIPQTVTGVKQIEKSIGLKAFPNPIADELTIEATTNETGKLTFKLFDALGRMILSGNLDNSKATINTSALEKGFYNLSVSNEKNVSLKTIKLVK